MREFKYVVTDPEGIHARPAGELVKAVKAFSSDIKIAKGGKAMNCFRSAPGSSEKEKCLTMDVQTGSNIGCGMNGNSCLEKICRYNRVIVKVMNSNIIVNSD